MSEIEYMRKLQVEATRLGLRLFRNHIGLGWSGKYQRLNATDVLIRGARPLRAGLCEGSSDLIGWLPLTITPQMVGSKIAVFSAVETKFGRGRTTKDQERFIEVVKDFGGFALVTRDLEDFREGLNGFLSKN